MPAYKEYNFFFHMQVFHDASHTFLLALVKAVRRAAFDAGSVVQKLSETGAGAYFVLKGQLLATAPHPPELRHVASSEGLLHPEPEQRLTLKDLLAKPVFAPFAVDDE